jgi:hypothetical protein
VNNIEVNNKEIGSGNSNEALALLDLPVLLPTISSFTVFV